MFGLFKKSGPAAVEPKGGGIVVNEGAQPPAAGRYRGRLERWQQRLEEIKGMEKPRKRDTLQAAELRNSIRRERLLLGEDV